MKKTTWLRFFSCVVILVTPITPIPPASASEEITSPVTMSESFGSDVTNASAATSTDNLLLAQLASDTTDDRGHLITDAQLVIAGQLLADDFQSPAAWTVINLLPSAKQKELGLVIPKHLAIQEVRLMIGTEEASSEWPVVWQSTYLAPYTTETNELTVVWFVAIARGVLIPINAFTGESYAAKIVSPFSSDPDSEDELPLTQTKSSNGFCSGCRAGIILEAAFSLSRRADGGSARMYRGQTMGDWDYINSDQNAKRIMRNKYGNNYWYIGHYGGMGVYGAYGGECKIFSDTILYRATRGLFTLPLGYNYGLANYRSIWAGDVVQRPAPNQHTAICYTILARDDEGCPTVIDVIDSNKIVTHHIAKHMLYGGELARYHCWWGSRASGRWY